MKVQRVASCLLALAAMPPAYAGTYESFCDLSGPEINCRIDVSSPSGGGNTPDLIRVWDYPSLLSVQVCSDWYQSGAAGERSMSFAEVDFRAPDKPDIKALLVLSTRLSSSGSHYLIVDWAAATPDTTSAGSLVPASVPVAVVPITACAPMSANPFSGIDNSVSVTVVARNEIAIAVAGKTAVRLKTQLGSNRQVAPTQVRVAPLIVDFPDKSIIHSLWSRR